jgi:hypothetical protein
MCLRKVIDLHVCIQAILTLIVYANSKASIADQGIEPVQLLRQLPCDLVCLLEGLKVALPPLDPAGVAPVLERLLCFGGVLFAL